MSRTLNPETTAVIVTCGSTQFLQRTLEGVNAQTQMPTRVVIVNIWRKGRDLGTGDDIQSFVTDIGLDTRTRVRVLAAPESATFGDAVRRGLALNAEAQRRADKMHETRTGEIPAIRDDTSPGWLWLLHDDSQPAPEALEKLVRTGESGPRIALVGAKQRAWSTPDRLLEVGIRSTASARRFNPIDVSEIDQGQYDHLDDVLAVGLAGALIRRDVWALTGGPDPALGPFGDGLELSRRIRLAGYRVVVEPTAVVFHARASYRGLRTFGHGKVEDQTPDVARSYRARRKAQLYNWVLATAAWKLPFVLLWLLVLSPVRALARLAAKDTVRARAELAAGTAVLSRPDLWMAGRRRARRTATISPSQLGELYISSAEIRRARRDERRIAADVRRTEGAPSELELRERAERASRRRIVAAVLALVSLAVAAVGFADLLQAHALTGGGTLPGSDGLGAVWAHAFSEWLAIGDGYPGPADPLFAVLAVPLVSGISLGAVLKWLLLLAVPLAGVTAWIAAGSATRSTALRALGAVFWAMSPLTLAAAGQGRVGAVLAIVAAPLVPYFLARALGVHRRDAIVSGMVGARRVEHAAPALPEPAVPEDGAEARTAADRDDLAVEPSPPAADGAESSDRADAADEPGEPHPRSGPAARNMLDDDADDEESSGPGDAAAEAEAIEELQTRRGRPSLGSAAAAALAFAVVAAGSPSLLVVGTALLLVLIAVSRSRGILWFVPLPALILYGPWLQEVISSGTWRALLGSPGVPVAHEAADPWQILLGVPEILAVSPVVGALLLVPGALTVFLAVVALMRGTIRARAVRVGHGLAAVGLALALVAPRITVAFTADGEPVQAWAGHGITLAMLGFLMAALSGADGVRRALTRYGFGFRQVTSTLIAAAAAGALVVAPITWILAARESSTVEEARSSVTPALSQQLATSDAQARTLALTPTETSLRVELWRGNGPQMVETSMLLGARTAHEVATADPNLAGFGGDRATQSLMDVAAAAAAGTSTDAAETLAEHAVGVVLVPPATDPNLARQRAELVANLATVPGVVLVTENESGAVFRVIVDDPSSRASAVSRVALMEQNVFQGPLTMTSEIEHSEEPRLVMLAERADPLWSIRRDWTSAASGSPASQPASDDWAQAFAIPPGEGSIDIRYEKPGHRLWLIGQAAVFVAVAFLALPVRRRRERDT